MYKKQKDLPFIEITPSEFEKLCYDFLLKQYPNYKLEIVSGCRDKGADLVGTFKDEQGRIYNIAVECKMAAHIPFRNFESAISTILKFNPKVNKIILMIASYVSPMVRHAISSLAKNINVEIEVIAAPQLNNLLFKYPDLIRKYFNEAFVNVKKRHEQLWFSLIGVIISLCLGLLSNTIFLKPKESLENKIIKVDKAIDNLKDLENYLYDIKNDIEKTQVAKEKIEKEYADSQRLKSITQEQIATISTALEKGASGKMVLNLAIGFILGIIASVLGNVIGDIYKKKKRQQSN